MPISTLGLVALDLATLPKADASSIAVFPWISHRDNVEIAVCRNVRLSDRRGGGGGVMAVASGSDDAPNSDDGLGLVTGLGTKISGGITGQFYWLGVGSHEP